MKNKYSPGLISGPGTTLDTGAESFSNQLNLYQSANVDNTSIRQNFVIRTTELEIILSDLKQKKSKDSLQHELILGRRGSGKSTLLKRIQVEIDENPDFSKKYIAINLAEEQAGIYRLSDLWYEVVKELNSGPATPVVLDAFSFFEDDQTYTRYLYEQVHHILKKLKKRLVLLLDNFDRILENLNEEAHLLREVMHNYRDFQIIGASTRMDEHFWKYDQPFYEFFRRHNLAALSFEDIHRLLNHWSEIMHKPVLKDYAIKNKGKIEALRIITDGLPRTMQFFIEILMDDTSLYGYDYIRKVMDRTTPLYQERLNHLTPPQRKIVLEMAFIWEACSTRQLVDKCRMEGKLISSYLKQLSDFGIVEIVRTDTKNHLYRIAERFFNMWIIVTQGNPDQKRKAKWLTIFLESWYDASGIKDLYANYSARLKSGNVSYDKASVITKALAQSKFISTGMRDEIIDLTTSLEDRPAIGTINLPPKYSQLKKRILDLIKTKNYKEALQLTDEIDNEEGGEKFFLRGNICRLMGDNLETIKNYNSAIEKGHINALYNLANLYSEQGEIKKAEKLFLQAIEKDDKNALNNLAFLYKEQGEIKKAEKLFLQAIEKDDKNALNNLAILYKEQGEIKKAEKFYLQAIEKDVKNALYNLANLYSEQGEFKKAEKFYLQAIEKGHLNALNNLAILYKKQGEIKKAEKFYLQAIEKGHLNALNNLANLYSEQGEIKKAEKFYLQAIEKGHLNALNNLAILYKEQGEIKKAEKFYLQAIEKGHLNALNNLANLYSEQGEFKKAEKFYLQAIEKDVKNALYNLANLYSEQGEFKKAEKFYLQAIEKGHLNALNNLAILYKEQGEIKKAEKFYLQAIEKDNVNALYNLANLYSEQGEIKKAEKFYLQAIEKDVKNALYNLAILYKKQGEFKKAEKLFLQAIEKDDIEALNNLAILYSEHGEFKKAEKFYLQAIEKDNVNALFNLAELYYGENKNKSGSSDLMNKYFVKTGKPPVEALELRTIVAVWTGSFENIQDEIEDILIIREYEGCKNLIENLLYLDQTALVMALFNDKVHGTPLQERYQLLYYAVQILTESGEKNLELKIPPDVQPTVGDIINKVKEKQVFYRREATVLSKND